MFLFGKLEIDSLNVVAKGQNQEFFFKGCTFFENIIKAVFQHCDPLILGTISRQVQSIPVCIQEGGGESRRGRLSGPQWFLFFHFVTIFNGVSHFQKLPFLILPSTDFFAKAKHIETSKPFKLKCLRMYPDSYSLKKYQHGFEE